MGKQLSLLPLMHQFDKEGFITDTTYWETDLSEKNDYYLVFHTETYTMFLPEAKDKWKWITEIVEAETVVITKGSYEGKKDCFELMFIDENKPPYTIILSDEQFSRETPLKENCWHGKLDIYVGGLYNCKNYFDKVYYRVADTLPCCKPVEE